MYQIESDDLDGVLWHAYESLLNHGHVVESSTKGSNVEIIGAGFQLNNPRARLSRSYNRGQAFSAIGEFIWYMSGSNEKAFVETYIGKAAYKDAGPDGILAGAYGPRLMGSGDNDQITTIISLLQEKPETRQAVIQLFDRSDLASRVSDLPCTCVLQFFLRDNRLDAVVYMRSNDVYYGLPHDVFCFTLIQESIARSIGAELGTYQHFVGSLHLYKEKIAAARSYMKEGLHYPTPASAMPAMPVGDPWSDLRDLVSFEQELRSEGHDCDYSGFNHPGYWNDLKRMLVGAHTKDYKLLSSLAANMEQPYYSSYLKDRRGKSNEAN